MSDSHTCALATPLSVAFDAGQLTSDGGLVWLAQVDDRLSLSAAYSLLDMLRRLLIQAGVARMQLDALRLRLIKIGGWVREHVREQAHALALHLASSHPGEPLWHVLAAHLTLRESSS
jgi:hypothetical protein